MQRLTRVGVFSLGKVMGMSLGLMGLIIGVLYGGIAILMGIVGGASAEHGGGSMFAMGVGGGVLAMVMIPMMYGFIGFVGGLIYGLILNLVLGLAGGLEVELRSP